MGPAGFVRPAGCMVQAFGMVGAGLVEGRGLCDKTAGRRAVGALRVAAAARLAALALFVALARVFGKIVFYVRFFAARAGCRFVMSVLASYRVCSVFQSFRPYCSSCNALRLCNNVYYFVHRRRGKTNVFI